MNLTLALLAASLANSPGPAALPPDLHRETRSDAVSEKVYALRPAPADVGAVALSATDPVAAIGQQGDLYLNTLCFTGTTANQSAVATTAAYVGVFAFGANSLDTALRITLEPGAYTAVVTGAGAITGLSLVEVCKANRELAR